jgi:AcrR family transcriptional regulator
MVETPWGTSESLRGRMLRPGPGNQAEEVAQNQRERIFGAMVASVSERGYTATRVSDLVELSGVSSRTFYDLFADKQTCFLATIEAVLAITMQAVAEADAANRERGWEERALAALEAFAESIVSQPAAARVCLIEAYAAGPEALKPLEEATAGFERVSQQIRLQTPERAGMPPEMMTVHVGALQEIARNRLRRGTVAELPGLMEEVAAVMFSYQPPPEPLRLTTRPPAPRPEDLDAHNHAERALRALAVVIAEKGYTQTTVDEVIGRASMSATTFYANFSGKEEALMAAIDSAGAQVVAAVMPAFERSTDWASGIRGAYGALFSFLATRPALADLLSVGVYGAGLPATQRRAKALAPLGALIERGSPSRRFQPPPIALEMIAGATYGLMYRQVRQRGPESLPALAPICTYIALAPFIGAEDACKAANGDGRGRGAGGDPRERVLLSQVLEILNKRKASAEAISREIGVSVEEVRDQIAKLERASLVVLMEEQTDADEGTTELFYRSNTDWIDEDRWEQMSQAERREVSAQVAQLMTDEIHGAIEADTFDARVDRHLSRLPLEVDEHGWRQLMAVHYRAFHASVAIQAESAERLKRSGAPGIRGSSTQALFEVPESPIDIGEHVLGHLQRQGLRPDGEGAGSDADDSEDPASDSPDGEGARA